MHFCEGRKEGRTQVRGMRGGGWGGGRGGGQLSEVSGSPGVLQLCVLNVFTLISFLPPFCPPRSFSSCTSPTTCCIPSSVSLVSITLHFCFSPMHWVGEIPMPSFLLDSCFNISITIVQTKQGNWPLREVLSKRRFLVDLPLD